MTNIETWIVTQYLKRTIKWIFKPTKKEPEMHCDFQASLEWDCLRSIVSIIRAGDMDRNKSLEVAQHASCFIGCAAEWAKSQDPAPGPDIIITATGDDLASQIESVIPPSGDVAGAIDWSTVLKVILPLLLQLLDDLFKEWNDDAV